MKRGEGGNKGSGFSRRMMFLIPNLFWIRAQGLVGEWSSWYQFKSKSHTASTPLLKRQMFLMKQEVGGRVLGQGWAFISVGYTEYFNTPAFPRKADLNMAPGWLGLLCKEMKWNWIELKWNWIDWNYIRSESYNVSNELHSVIRQKRCPLKKSPQKRVPKKPLLVGWETGNRGNQEGETK
jgi:hypothetical protein